MDPDRGLPQVAPNLPCFLTESGRMGAHCWDPAVPAHTGSTPGVPRGPLAPLHPDTMDSCLEGRARLFLEMWSVVTTRRRSKGHLENLQLSLSTFSTRSLGSAGAARLERPRNFVPGDFQNLMRQGPEQPHHALKLDWFSTGSWTGWPSDVLSNLDFYGILWVVQCWEQQILWI